MIKAGHITMCINHWAESSGFKGVTFNQLCSVLTGKRFEMPNASYRKPVVVHGKKPTADIDFLFKLRFCKFG
jgi:hypothetical protein